MPRDWDRLILVGILLLAFALRTYRLDTQSIWYDEAVTAQVTARGLAELTGWTANDIQPPLYYYLVAGWRRLAGGGEWALRFPSAMFGMLTVPLLWAMARRLAGTGAGSRAAGHLAAALGAVSPLYVYYAQEARMYTLLVTLGLLTGYLLWRAVAGEAGTAGARRMPGVAQYVPWLAVVLSGAALLYTHYFGAFLLAAYAVCLAAAGWRSQSERAGQLRVARRAIGAAAGILLLYSPWLPAMLNRYGADRSYWQGPLKLDEALRHVAVSFVAGAPETMLESAALRLLPAAALALASVALAARKPVGGRNLLYPALTGLVTLAGVFVLVMNAPKFNARYLSMVSPAYLLILAGGIAALAAPDAAHWRSGRRVALGIVAVSMAGFVLAVSYAGLHNWFFDPAFTKAQWRQVAETVQSHRQPGEAVLLVSGHAYPAWEYYAPEIAPTRLPEIDVLDVDAVLGFSTGAVLQDALRGKRGVWVVSWQAEAVDPAAFVPYYLDRAGSELPQVEQFWQVGLRHWRLRDDAGFPTTPQPTHADSANFRHQLTLLGWDAPAGGQITLYWQALNTILRDYQVSLVLQDAAGRDVPGGRWDGRPATYAYPTYRWRPGETLFGRYPLVLPPAAQPGQYYLAISVYDAQDLAGLDIMDVADNPAGKRVRIGPFDLPGSS